MTFTKCKWHLRSTFSQSHNWYMKCTSFETSNKTDSLHRVINDWIPEENLSNYWMIHRLNWNSTQLFQNYWRSAKMRFIVLVSIRFWILNNDNRFRKKMKYRFSRSHYKRLKLFAENKTVATRFTIWTDIKS